LKSNQTNKHKHRTHTIFNFVLKHNKQQDAAQVPKGPWPDQGGQTPARRRHQQAEQQQQQQHNSTSRLESKPNKQTTKLINPTTLTTQ
jgi:hypothetical protein